MSSADDVFEAARTAYDANATLAQRTTVKVVRELASAYGADGVREALADVLPDLMRLYGGVAVEVALEQYQGMRDLVPDLPPYDVPVSDRALWSSADGVSRSILDGLSPSSVDQLSSLLSNRVASGTYAMADSQLFAWARGDPAHPRWALVPHPGACGWCLLMGSRGFDFVSGETLKPVRHPNCRCTPTVDFSDSPRLRGYDPEGLREIYRKALRESSGSGKALRNDTVRHMNEATGYWREKYRLRKEREK